MFERETYRLLGIFGQRFITVSEGLICLWNATLYFQHGVLGVRPTVDLDSMLLNLMPNVATSSQHVLYYSVSVVAGGFSVKTVMAELIAT